MTSVVSSCAFNPPKGMKTVLRHSPRRGRRIIAQDKRSAVLGRADKMERKPRRGDRNSRKDSKGDSQRFRPCRKTPIKTRRALQAAEKLDLASVLKGHCFSRVPHPCASCAQGWESTNSSRSLFSPPPQRFSPQENESAPRDTAANLPTRHPASAGANPRNPTKKMRGPVQIGDQPGIASLCPKIEV